MMRLLQGDVGSGKNVGGGVVASLKAIDNGKQVAVKWRQRKF